MTDNLDINKREASLGEVSSTTKSREQADFERQQIAAENEHKRRLELAEKEYQQQQDAADKALQRQKEWWSFLGNFLVGEIGVKLFAGVVLSIVVYNAWTILQNPARTADQDKFATSILIAIATGFISYLTGRTVIVK